MKKNVFCFMAVFFAVILFQMNVVYSQHNQEHSHSNADQKQYEQREERYRVRMYWQIPNRVLNELGVKPGQIIGDVGCGIGYFSLRLAEKVGESGKVYASDIDKGALQYLEERCRENGIQNIQIILGEENDPLLPKANIDLVMIVNTIQFVDDPTLFLNNIKSCLKSNGRVAIITWDAEKMDSELPGWSPDDRKKYTLQTILRTIYDAKYEVIQMLDFLPMQMIYVCQPRTK